MTEKKKSIIILCVTALFTAGVILSAVFLGLYFAHDPVEEYRCVGYLMSDTVNAVDDVNDLPIHDITHMIYGFVAPSDGSVEPYVDEESKVALEKLSGYAKEHPSVKLMISLNGNGFCYVFRTAERRKAFIENLRPIVEKYCVKGVDVDWEYPMRDTGGFKHCSHDAQDYAAFMEDMRAAFGKDFVLSIALCGSVTFMNDLLNHRMAKTLDFVNVMTYDLGMFNHCGYTETASAMFNAYLAGYSKKQLNLGLPFYSRCKVEDFDYIGFDDLMALEKAGEIKIKRTREYCYATYHGQRLSFDDREHLMKKVELVKKRGYGGVFCWCLSYNMDGSLMREANERLNGI